MLPPEYNPISQLNLSAVHQHIGAGHSFFLLSFATAQAETLLDKRIGPKNKINIRVTTLKAENIYLLHYYMAHVRALNLHSYIKSLLCPPTVYLERLTRNTRKFDDQKVCTNIPHGRTYIILCVLHRLLYNIFNYQQNPYK